jgi:hypothetical protein
MINYWMTVTNCLTSIGKKNGYKIKCLQKNTDVDIMIVFYKQAHKLTCNDNFSC